MVITVLVLLQAQLLYVQTLAVLLRLYCSSLEKDRFNVNDYSFSGRTLTGENSWCNLGPAQWKGGVL